METTGKRVRTLPVPLVSRSARRKPRSDSLGAPKKRLEGLGERWKWFGTALRVNDRYSELIGIAGLLWSGLGLVAAIEYALDTVWQVKGRGMRDKLGGLLWLAGAGALFLASFAFTTALNFLPAALAPVGIVLGLAIDVALWLWTFKVLTNTDIGWKALLPGAVLGSVGLEILKAVGSIYVPRLVASSSAMYGSLGVVFAVLAWLLLFGRLTVYAATLNVVRWEEGHGTVTVELQAPRIPGTAPVEATRAGDVLPYASR